MSELNKMIPKDILSRIVEAGTWAPSGDNCQPWRFTWDGQKRKEGSRPHKALLVKGWGYLRNVFPVDRSKGIIMLFRIGYASPPPVRAPRKAVNDVFLT
ncbi:MAG: nitroreductase family protein [Thermodesulfobacteriota bacterium]